MLFECNLFGDHLAACGAGARKHTLGTVEIAFRNLPRDDVRKCTMACDILISEADSNGGGGRSEGTSHSTAALQICCRRSKNRRCRRQGYLDSVGHLERHQVLCGEIVARRRTAGRKSRRGAPKK